VNKEKDYKERITGALGRYYHGNPHTPGRPSRSSFKTKRKPPDPSKPPLEKAEQLKLIGILRKANIMVHASPNAARRDPRWGKHLVNMGMLTGYPDVTIFDPPPKAKGVGVMIELKRINGGWAKPHQQEVLQDLANRGWVCAVAQGYLSSVAFLLDLGYNLRLTRGEKEKLEHESDTTLHKRLRRIRRLVKGK